MSSIWTIEAADSLFFRELRPFAGPGAELSSRFPPPLPTVLSAFRTAVGNWLGVDWNRLQQNPEASELVGQPDQPGRIQLKALYPQKQAQWFVPTPLNLMTVADNGQLLQYVIGQTIATDLGNTALPQLPAEFQSVKTKQHLGWLSLAGLGQLRAGITPEYSSTLQETDLLQSESRVGIAMTPARVAAEGELYQTRHIRLRDRVSLVAEMDGLPEAFCPPGGNHIVRLGGEGRMAVLHRYRNQHSNLAASGDLGSIESPDLSGAAGIILYLLSPLTISRELDWLSPHSPGGMRPGTLRGVKIDPVSACIGKPEIFAGWDLQNNCPRPPRSMLPAGCCWYCHTPDIAGALMKLNDFFIGDQIAYGYGRICAGIWKEPET